MIFMELMGLQRADAALFQQWEVAILHASRNTPDSQKRQMEAKGAVKEATGQAEQTVAKVAETVKGVGEQVSGKAKELVGKAREKLNR